MASVWSSAPAERSDDGALDFAIKHLNQSGVALRLPPHLQIRVLHEKTPKTTSVIFGVDRSCKF